MNASSSGNGLMYGLWGASILRFNGGRTHGRGEARETVGLRRFAQCELVANEGFVVGRHRRWEQVTLHGFCPQPSAYEDREWRYLADVWRENGAVEVDGEGERRKERDSHRAVHALFRLGMAGQVRACGRADEGSPKLASCKLLRL